MPDQSIPSRRSVPAPATFPPGHGSFATGAASGAGTHLPPWIVLHIPHDSVYIPMPVRRQMPLTDAELDRELLRMTDFWTFALFGNGVPTSRTVIAPVSRLVVDVERFADDAVETMAARGMGVVYTATSDKTRLRKEPSAKEREQLINTWYAPHHRRLTQKVDELLDQYGRALVLDCHSFASRPLPYEDNPDGRRPEICIGTDDFHTDPELAESAGSAFEAAGFDTGHNSPFAGALTPLKHYRRDKRVASLMIEVRRDLYEEESSGALIDRFGAFSRAVTGCVAKALRDID
jgi:N-formylglutamate amidohydrolase